MPNKKIHAKNDVIGPGLYTEDWQISATGQSSQSILQRGPVTLAAGTATITLPTSYISAANSNLCFFVSPISTNNPMFFNGIVSAQYMGSTKLSAVTGFNVSGSGTDKGYWMVLGYR